MNGNLDNAMSFVGFSNIHFYQTVLTGIFILNIRNNYFKNSLVGCFGNVD